MNIWIMRHGEAGFNAATDSERSLTDNGREMAFQQGRWLGALLDEQGLELDCILVSPYLRTRQTAECLQDGIQAVSSVQSFANGQPEKIEYWQGITPAGTVDNVLNYLNFLAQNGAENVLIISHLPLVFDLTHALGGKTVHFYPAVIAQIAWDGTRGSLKGVKTR